MDEKKLYSPKEIAADLGVGDATIKFWSNRFQNWLTFEIIDQERCFPFESVEILRVISASTNAGLTTHQIEETLVKRKAASEQSSSTQPADEPAANPINLDMLSHPNMASFFQSFIEQQKRIADAQEKRTEIEAQKTEAMFQRAAAEQAKAEALNHIAASLQNIDRRKTEHGQIPSNQLDAIVQDQVKVIENLTKEEAPPVAGDIQVTPDMEIENLASQNDSTVDPSPADTNIDFEIDALSDLLNIHETSPEDSISESLKDFDLPDLEVSSPAPSTDSEISSHNLDTPAESKMSLELDDLPDIQEIMSDTPSMPLDDLSQLLDESSTRGPSTLKTPENIDDLSMLLDGSSDEKSHESDIPVDDLSALLQDQSTTKPTNIDNLAALIDTDPSEPVQVDDLSLLVDSNPMTESFDIDDLSQLVGGSPEAKPVNKKVVKDMPKDVDNLSLLVPSSSTGKPNDIDDLGKLVGKPVEKTVGPKDVDDLSQLVQSTSAQTAKAVDDLSQLVSPTLENKVNTVDDLSKLVSAPPETNSAQPAQAKPLQKPDQKATLEKYKSKIISLIIKLKEKEGLTEDETLKRFNDQGIKPLTGKGKWSIKGIKQIYNYIDTVRKKKK